MSSAFDLKNAETCFERMLRAMPSPMLKLNTGSADVETGHRKHEDGLLELPNTMLIHNAAVYVSAEVQIPAIAIDGPSDLALMASTEAEDGTARSNKLAP